MDVRVTAKPAPRAADAPRQPEVAQAAAPNPPASLPPLIGAWSSSAQWTGAALMAGLLALLCFHFLAESGASPRQDLPRLDLNRATFADLTQLPGVGPGLAHRIEARRQTHGPFQTVDELRQVSGIGPATLEKIRPFVRVSISAGLAAGSPPAVKSRVTKAGASATGVPNAKALALAGQTINVNLADATELQKLPGIGNVLSQRIIEERRKQPFKSAQDLRRVKGIGPKTLEKIRPFVTLGEPALAAGGN